MLTGRIEAILSNDDDNHDGGDGEGSPSSPASGGGANSPMSSGRSRSIVPSRSSAKRPSVVRRPCQRPPLAPPARPMASRTSPSRPSRPSTCTRPDQVPAVAVKEVEGEVEARRRTASGPRKTAARWPASGSGASERASRPSETVVAARTLTRPARTSERASVRDGRRRRGDELLLLLLLGLTSKAVRSSSWVAIVALEAGGGRGGGGKVVVVVVVVVMVRPRGAVMRTTGGGFLPSRASSRGPKRPSFRTTRPADRRLRGQLASSGSRLARRTPPGAPFAARGTHEGGLNASQPARAGRGVCAAVGCGAGGRTGAGSPPWSFAGGFSPWAFSSAAAASSLSTHQPPLSLSSPHDGRRLAHLQARPGRPRQHRQAHALGQEAPPRRRHRRGRRLDLGLLYQGPSPAPRRLALRRRRRRRRRPTLRWPPSLGRRDPTCPRSRANRTLAGPSRKLTDPSFFPPDRPSLPRRHHLSPTSNDDQPSKPPARPPAVPRPPPGPAAHPSTPPTLSSPTHPRACFSPTRTRASSLTSTRPRWTLPSARSVGPLSLDARG